MFGNSYNPYAYNPYAVQYQPQQQSMMQNQQQQQMQQMQPTQMSVTNQPQTTNSGIIWVSGLEEANNFLVAPNNAVALWDRNGKSIYLKSADATGLSNVKIMDISERKATEAVLPDAKEFVLLDDFKAFRGEFDELKGIVNGLTAKKSKKESNDNE